MSRLPPELWLLIFRHAATTNLTSSLVATTYLPFHAVTQDFVDHSLKVKHTIVQVCRMWRDLGTGLLYEDLLVRSEHARGLRDTMEKLQRDESGHMHRVRRVCLPYSSSVPQMAIAYPTDAMMILKSCSSLEVLVRPNMLYGSRGEAMLFDYQAEDCPPLPSLKRLDWWHRNDAARTEGINCLPHVLRETPNLTYLSLEGEVGLSLMQLNIIISLPKLTTLHFRRINMLFILQISKWDLPTLRTIVLDGFTDQHMLYAITQYFGKQLRTLEFGMSLKFFAIDALLPLLTLCRLLEEVNYYVFFTKFPDELAIPHPSLTTVGLHGAHNAIYHGHPQELWYHAERHFDHFCSSFFPALKKVILYGDWRLIINDPRYPAWVEKFKSRGCTVTTEY